jgi:hypothetical protein
MARITISAHTIRVGKPYHAEALNFNDIEGDDFLVMCQSYLNGLKNYETDATIKRVLKIKRLEIDAKERLVSGILETGEYGYESELVNFKTKQITHHREEEEAEVLPFYFLFYLPKDKNCGVILLQRFAQYGIREAMENALRLQIDKSEKKITLRINQLVPREYVQDYLKKGRLLSVSFTQFKVRRDFADQWAHGSKEEDYGRTEFVIHAKRKGFLPLSKKLKEVISGDREISKMIEIKNFDYDAVKIQVDLEGKLRTIKLDKLDKIRAYYDIDQEVKIGKNGHPEYKTIDDFSKKLLRALIKRMEGEDSGE